MKTRLLGMITGDLARYVGLDKSTRALLCIDYAHHEIHGGSAYTVSQKTAVNAFDITSPMTFHITTPNTAKYAHIIILGEANTPAYWELFEDNGVAANFNISSGSSVTPKNRNRNSSKTSKLTIKSGVTVTQATTDVLIDVEAIAKSAGGGERHEWVLKANTEYLVRATSYTDNNEGSLTLDWYEHTNKD